MGSKGLSAHNLPSVTPEEETRIREQFKTFVVGRAQSKYCKALHLGTESGKVCDHRMPSGGRHKDIAVYPPGYRKICRECAELWRRSNGGAADE